MGTINTLTLIAQSHGNPVQYIVTLVTQEQRNTMTYSNTCNTVTG